MYAMSLAATIPHEKLGRKIILRILLKYDPDSQSYTWETCLDGMHARAIALNFT